MRLFSYYWRGLARDGLAFNTAYGWAFTLIPEMRQACVAGTEINNDAVCNAPFHCRHVFVAFKFEFFVTCNPVSLPGGILYLVPGLTCTFNLKLCVQVPPLSQVGAKPSTLSSNSSDRGVQKTKTQRIVSIRQKGHATHTGTFESKYRSHSKSYKVEAIHNDQAGIAVTSMRSLNHKHLKPVSS